MSGLKSPFPAAVLSGSPRTRKKWRAGWTTRATSSKPRCEPSNVRPKADRLAALREMEKLHQDRVETRNKLKKEKNLGSQVSLNTRIKQLNDRIEAIRNEL